MGARRAAPAREAAFGLKLSATPASALALAAAVAVTAVALAVVPLVVAIVTAIVAAPLGGRRLFVR